MSGDKQCIPDNQRNAQTPNRGLCQKGKIWAQPLGVLELIKCKALRVRATGVYFRK